MRCIRCGSAAIRRDGCTRLGGQRWRCTECRRRFTARSSSAFSRHGFADEVIALSIRWYVRYRLSYADVAEWLAERGIMVDRSTIYRWVQRFLPLFIEAARDYTRPVGGKWRVDETYCRLNGRWAYCYRGIERRTGRPNVRAQRGWEYLRKLGNTPQVPRPSNAEADKEEQEAFKKSYPSS
jgi:transposase-like protein